MKVQFKRGDCVMITQIKLLDEKIALTRLRVKWTKSLIQLHNAIIESRRITCPTITIKELR